MKKPWSTPQLVSLVRAAPEEAVLVACKVTAMGGPLSANPACMDYEMNAQGLGCTPCNTNAPS